MSENTEPNVENIEAMFVQSARGWRAATAA